MLERFRRCDACWFGLARVEIGDDDGELYPEGYLRQQAHMLDFF